MAVNKFVTINDTTQALEEATATLLGGTGNENKIPQTDSAGRLDSSFMPVGISPETYTGNAFEAIAANALVYIKADGTVANASAASGGNYATGWAAGAQATIGSPVTVNFEGTLSGLSALTPNTSYFLSASSAGGITATAPTGTSQLRQVVGYALTATTLNFTNSGVRIKRA